jgi:chromosome segregation ATPase
MSWIECNNCEEMTDVCGGAVRLPYICGRCEKDSVLAIEQDTYNSGVPCQSALDGVQADVYDIQDAHNDVLDQFDEDTKLIEDLRLQLEQANLNIQVLEETIEDLETQLTDLRLDMCNVVFRTNF